ncbi:MAG TPA: DUF5666 domain-containing protein [Candidatus Binatia bacterium]|jgi:hypothetical protein
MKIPHRIVGMLAAALLLVTLIPRLGAQIAPVAVRGKITAVKGQELSVATPKGEFRVTVSDKTVIRQEAPINLSDIEPGMYLGTTAAKQADGMFRASEVHVMSEDQRGLSEGHRPSSSTPGSTMTNANVEKVEDVVVQDVKGRVMSLKYKGGEVKIFVPPDIRLVKGVAASREALKPGAEISAQATPNADNTMSATQITVRAPGR